MYRCLSVLLVGSALIIAGGCRGTLYTYRYYPDHGVYHDVEAGTYYWYQDDVWHSGEYWEGSALGTHYVISSAHAHPRHDHHFATHHLHP